MSASWAIGLMTGTVLDGNVDVALIQTDGETITAFGPWKLVPYSTEITGLLRRSLDAARDWNFEGPEPSIFREAEDALTRAQSDAVLGFLDRAGVASDEIRAIGFHGQTVLHRAPAKGQHGATRQLGNGALMAEMTGIDVVYDFRSADMAAGGQGAPLSAIYHRALLMRIGAGSDTAILNLGGVGNISWCDGDTVMAFDTGPANAPLNDWIGRHTGAAMDKDGAVAATGRADEARIAAALEHPYFASPFPKSLDRFDFTAALADGLSLADGAATLTGFTAATVGRALDLLPRRPARLIVCGGGRKNPHMMAEIERRAGVDIVLADAVGLRGDAVEAECFGYLAMRSLRDLPLSFPLTTGVSQPQTGGRVALARKAG